tara:strand:- start:32 stop:178 length:147 start_codon:yes stop_codon:yes gene_type:complete
MTTSKEIEDLKNLIKKEYLELEDAKGTVETISCNINALEFQLRQLLIS